ncbi:CopD family protein [Bordetella flabilis]|uniref:Protoporphyrinogen IX oxidase n=1 Tax=Bordetella flabilis TaxID=463014 RepID=A0A193GDX0_9BORD|nr:CopD family protein [Bordetella flabilis]ANN77484.1 hypothetical protein BAU07_10560 [Bordetella flabilis]
MSVYPYLVAAHVTAVVFLVGGMLAHDRVISALTRLPQQGQSSTLMALLRLDRHVVTPALLLAWVFGLSLALWAGWLSAPWLQIKLVIVVALSALHGVQSGRLRGFVREGKPPTPIPGAGIAVVAAMLAIAVLAIARPV